jgi:tetratricopeptide (TPR) repeat protein
MKKILFISACFAFAWAQNQEKDAQKLFKDYQKKMIKLDTTSAVASILSVKDLYQEVLKGNLSKDMPKAIYDFFFVEREMYYLKQADAKLLKTQSFDKLMASMKSDYERLKNLETKQPKYSTLLYLEQKKKRDEFFNAGALGLQEPSADFEKCLANFEKAQLHLQMIGEKDSESSFWAGYASLQSKNYDKSVVFFKQAIEGNYRAEDAYGVLVQILTSQNKAEEATKYLDEALVLFPSNKDLLDSKIDLFITKAQYKEAENFVADLLKQDPENARLNFNAGVVYVGIGNTFYTKSADAKTNKDYENLKVQFTKYFNLSIKHFERALELNPALTETYQNLFQLYGIVGNYEKAQEYKAKMEQK